jgi:hypothetical protein
MVHVAHAVPAVQQAKQQKQQKCAAHASLAVYKAKCRPAAEERERDAVVATAAAAADALSRSVDNVLSLSVDHVGRPWGISPPFAYSIPQRLHKLSSSPCLCHFLEAS